MKRWKQGIYTIKNPNKYLGSTTSKGITAVYRSSWERIAFEYLDKCNNVISWGSERVVVPYHFSIDNKVHRYYIDLYFETNDGRFLIEIKPKSKLTRPGKGTKDRVEYIRNIDKWKSAKAYSKSIGATFSIWTEDTINNLKLQLSTS